MYYREVVKDSTGDQKYAFPTLNTSEVIATGDSEHNPIDYLGLPVNPNFNFTGNIFSRYMVYKSYTVKLGRVWLRAIAFNCNDHMAVMKLLSLLDKHRNNGQPMEVANWVLVANDMSIYKCVKYKPGKCQKLLNNALDLYKKV